MQPRSPFVHGFPYPGDAPRIVKRRHAAFFFACLSPIVRPAGFSPPHGYPCFIGPEYGTTRESATLCPSSLRGLLVDSVCYRFRQLPRQDRRASLGKTHHLTVSRPASCQVGSPDIRTRLVTSARPPPKHHLADSLFATYTASASGFLQTHRFRKCPCFVGVVLPSGNGGPSYPR